MVTEAECAAATVFVRPPGSSGYNVIFDPVLRQACTGLYYASLDPQTRAFEINLDLGATATAQLGMQTNRGLDSQARINRLQAAFGAVGLATGRSSFSFIDFPGVGVDPNVIPLLTNPAMVGGNVFDTQALARALIASGDLRLGPEAFAAPEARAALAMALMPTASPVGGSMSSSWFGLGGTFSGATTPILPFGNPFQAGGTSPFFPPPADAVGGGIFSVLGPLLNTGAQFLAQRELNKQQEDLFKLQLRSGFTAGGGAQVVIGPDGTLQMGGAMGMTTDPMTGQLCVPGQPGCAGPVWPMIPASTGACCPPRGAVTVTPADAPSLYRAGCNPCSPIQTRARFFALRADGTRDLFVRVGKVQSVSPRALTRFARRWAKEAGLTTAKRGSGGRRRARRRPR